jgi:hypothetical protein
MIVRAILVSAALLTSAVVCAAEASRFKLPDFSHLQAKATESVDISIGPFMLWIAERMAPERDENGTEVKKILEGIDSVHVRSYQFDEDHVYSRDDIEAVRKQLRDDRWQSLAAIHSSKKDENVDIFVAVENDKAKGFAIVASEPREFTIVHIVGSVDPQHLASLQHTFGSKGGRRLATINNQD